MMRIVEQEGHWKSQREYDVRIAGEEKMFGTTCLRWMDIEWHKQCSVRGLHLDYLHFKAWGCQLVNSSFYLAGPPTLTRLSALRNG